jgi:hypothetical protein
MPDALKSASGVKGAKVVRRQGNPWNKYRFAYTTYITSKLDKFDMFVNKDSFSNL